MWARSLVYLASLLIFRPALSAVPLDDHHAYNPVGDGPDPDQALSVNARLAAQARNDGLAGPPSADHIKPLIDLSALENLDGAFGKRGSPAKTTYTTTVTLTSTSTTTTTSLGQTSTLTTTTTTTSTSLATATIKPAPPPRFPYGSVPVRGVNLGGWLVVECWITPSLCGKGNDSRIIDEWTFGQYLGRETGTRYMRQHWSTFITEKDFKLIARYGLNHVRIPIGYWAFDISAGEPYIQGAYPYLLKAIQWARKYNIKVFVDLHGAPGSQNGYDNSGRYGDALWASQQSNIDRTTAVLQTLAHKFAHPSYASVVTTIELLNEPATYKPGIKPAVKPFYYQGYQAVRYAGTKYANGISVLIQDAFLGLTSWYGFMQPPTWQNVLLGTHSYVTFNKVQSNYTDVQLQKYYCGLAQGLSDSNKNLRTIVGEWTPPRTDCAYLSYPNGVPSHYVTSHGLAACHGKTLALGPLSQETIIGMKKMFELQTTIYEDNTSGWVMWTWKHEVSKEWSYLGGIEGGWIPTKPTKKTYGDQCAQFQ